MCPTEELETGEVSGADGFPLAPDTCASSHLIAGGPGRHCHHRDSNEDSVSKGEEKLGIRKVRRLGLSLNSHEEF